ncbi:hypothetical protein FACS1894202_01230 [Clostridia bacterium]|nr:hypothetical protein FACS1894202_01230 [Clostridia bacterium]
MQTTNVVAVTAARNAGFEREPLNLRKRIGSTTFIIGVATSPSATERAEKKILRLIESEVSRIA